MPKIAAGVVKFQEQTFPRHKELFEKLASGQEPEALFVTCSDSRIDPSLMTSTEPGQLFICRNAGNIVPPHTTPTGAMTASLEFAVGALKVPHIVVCGHTECGAMKGAMNLDALNSLPHTKEWLSFSAAAVSIVKEKGAKMSDEEKMHLLIQENVLLQIQHLRTHPTVAAAVAAGRIQLHGWVYDIKTGAVEAYDFERQEFLPVAERYQAEVAAYAQKFGHVH